MVFFTCDGVLLGVSSVKYFVGGEQICVSVGEGRGSKVDKDDMVVHTSSREARPLEERNYEPCVRGRVEQFSQGENLLYHKARISKLCDQNA